MLAADGVATPGIYVHSPGIFSNLSGDVAYDLLRRSLTRAQRTPWKFEQGELNGEAEAVRRTPAPADSHQLFLGEGVVTGHEPLVEVHRQLVEPKRPRQ